MKTVYILGAGFSIPAGGPTQESLMNEIWALQSDPDTDSHKKEFEDFLRNNLYVDPLKVSLEDIYTPIDRCLSDNISLRDLSEGGLQQLREKISYLVSRALEQKFQRGPVRDHDYVENFAKHLVEKASVRAEKAKATTCKKAAKDYDPFSVISLNWDILLDNALSKEVELRDGPVTNDYGPFGVVDYCCHISSLKSDDRRIRTGLWSLGARGYNIKLLKIHGSMNWLQCPRCQQLFVGFDEKHSVVNYTNPHSCRHCQKQGTKS
jgi:hypothetical protein